MAYDVYQSAALVLRYAFAGAGLFIAGRCAYMCMRDGRQARFLRAQAGETGAVAKLSVYTHGGAPIVKPLNREGVVGAGRGSDVRVPRAGLERRHFAYEMVNGQLRVTPIGGADLFDGDQKPARALSVPPGGCFYAGDAKLEYRLIRQTAEPISAAVKRTYGERLRTLVKPPEGLRGRRGDSRRFR